MLVIFSRVPLKNFSFKKFVSDVPGAIDVLLAIGFVHVDDDLLELSGSVEATLLISIIAKLEQKTNVSRLLPASHQEDIVSL